MKKRTDDSAYGYGRKQWEKAKEEARLAIVKQARIESDMTYGELTRAIRNISFEPHDHVFHLMLGQISEEEDAAGRGMLTALVVCQDDRRPGPGFWRLAARLGRNTKDREKFWTEEFQQVVRGWKRN